MPRRGRQPTYEEMVMDMRDDGQMKWHKTFVVLARTTIGGKKVRGICYKRVIATKIGGSFGEYELTRVYATRKEVFEDNLRNGNET